ncbi:hypothetical protein TCAL_11352 [Tigriopus californicus]|uniref:CSC1/OSCA1-like 7TM region domain-containing protein n=1 Tax=Tigriopus californicus TaxID=6832 RepID=A0A553PFB5_TIGCA|nr:CSC1-like protein 2 [Tigriopus californicus]TRY76367.1 hypothetical protein TCAL_11352 [Tigriopus californicus]|eukprot:TCALIF_11352-PA protein Name:"Similar to TMEM63B Transmembrane protein 63B (Homo sapiens)" AED:0.06 eAED:0.06 QI:0/-1/0/1/-1/1/1/0/855
MSDAEARPGAGFPPFNTTTPDTPLEPPVGKCNYYMKNDTAVILDFTIKYGGIPQNLVINLVGWALLVGLFALLRRAAGNYGRLALVRKDDDESKWTQVFFAPDDYNQDDEDLAHEPDSMSSVDYSEVDSSVCSWITSVFTLSDDKFMRKCGLDVVQYLRFQRHLILLVLIMSLVCVGIILPINFQGEIQGTKVDFGHTTISNLQGSDERLWVHVILCILFFPVGVYLMRRFSVDLKMDAEDCISSRTLMLVGVPESQCSLANLRRHFHEAYPNYPIEDIQLAFDVSTLCDLDAKRELARRARVYCETYQSRYGAGQQMKPFACGILFTNCHCWPRCCPSVDALTFYTREEACLKQAVEDEKRRIKNKSIGMAFVTFANLHEAKLVKKDFKAKCQCLAAPPTSSISDRLETYNWSVRFAPPPEDIYWENLNDTHRLFFVKALLINVVVFIVLFFFTSPAYIISELELFLNFKDITKWSKINDFLPTLMLWTLSALLPIIVAYSDWWMGHWRRSVENLWIFRKVYFYLLFMVLILPSIGLTSLRAMLEFFIHSQSDPDENMLKWSCIFLPDNGAFFVNYVITSALVGTALELMRFSELFMYAIRLMFTRSVAETPSARKANLLEFPFGFNYGWMLLIFALTSAYAVVCPLITPFGLFYMIMKHGVDRYNLYYAYKRSKINKNIHATAVNCVIVSLLLQQLVLLFFNIVRAPDNKILSPRAIFSIAILSIFTLMFLAQMFFHMFKGISPLQYVQTPVSSSVGSPEPHGAASPVMFQPGPMETAESEDRPHTRRRRRHQMFLPAVLKGDGDMGSVIGSQDVEAHPLGVSLGAGSSRHHPSRGALGGQGEYGALEEVNQG